MFDELKKWFNERRKGKLFKYIALLIVLIAIAVAVNTIDLKNNVSNETSETEQESEDENSEEKNQGFHIGAGHIVMLVLLVGAYGIDRVVVFRNKLEDDKKYSNFKEEK